MGCPAATAAPCGAGAEGWNAGAEGRGADGAKCCAGARNCCGARNWRICWCIRGVNSWVDVGGRLMPRDGARNSLDGALVGARNSRGETACSRPGATNWPAGARPSRPGAVTTWGPPLTVGGVGRPCSVADGPRGAATPLAPPLIAAGPAPRVAGATPLGISLVSLGTLAGGLITPGRARLRPAMATLVARCG